MKQAAVYSTIPERTLRYLIAERRVRFFKIGVSVRLDVDDLDRLIVPTEPLRADAPSVIAV